MTADILISFNTGSSSIKLGLFELRGASAVRVAAGAIDFRKHPLRFHLTEGPAVFDVELKAHGADDLSEVIKEAFWRLAKHFDVNRVVSIGHRVVHGGDKFVGPVRIDDNTLDDIDALTELAPLHQPQALRSIHAVRKIRPDIVQIASFDTAFHRTNREEVRRFAIPRKFHDVGIKRYGFHGLSYKYIAGELARRMPDIEKGKVVVAHLGSGASLCGLAAGVSQDSSMGFSTLDGIPMATRCGALDAGVMLHLFGQLGYKLSEVEDIVYRQSGLLGVSGISADTRDLLDSPLPEARLAIDLFTLRIAGEVARLATTLGGLDGLVFTAGIGEHQPPIRAAVARHLAWLGLELDDAANSSNTEAIHAGASRIGAFVIPTDEERVIADEALSIIQGSGAAA